MINDGHPNAQQLHLLPSTEMSAPVLPAARSAAQLSLLTADALPPQLRIDARTRRVGRAGIAELRRILNHDSAAA
jgi:hypothetical protein